MMNKIISDIELVIDGNNMLHRAYWKFRNMRSRKGVVTSMIYGLPFMLKSLIVKFGPDRVVVVFDGGRHPARMKLLPTYKARDSKLGFDLENFKEQKDVIIEMLMALGIRVIMERHHEADDLIYWRCRRNTRKGIESIIVSGDKDFKQVIDKFTSVWDPGKEYHFKHNNTFQQLGVYPNQVVDYLCLLGDDSDKIPGYPGIGEVYAKDFLSKYTSIQHFLNSGETYKKVDKQKLAKIWKLNRQLIDLRIFYVKNYKGKMKLPVLNPKPKWQPKKLRKICEKYSLRSFMQDEFLRTFKNLYNEK